MHGQGVEVDKTLAVEYFRKAADGGYYLAQQVLEQCDVDGSMGDADEMNRAQLAVAFKEIQQGAEQGLPEAQYRLARSYMYGDGVDQNIDKAIQWFQKAIEQGHEKAKQSLDMLMFDLCKHHAEQGNPDAQYELGLRYWDGIGIEQNREEADQWFRQAAEQGHEQAKQITVEIGFFKFKYNAEQGDADAQFMLSVSYLYGLGVEQDMDEASRWLRKAAEQGHKQALQAIEGKPLMDCVAEIRKEKRESGQ